MRHFHAEPGGCHGPDRRVGCFADSRSYPFHVGQPTIPSAGSLSKLRHRPAQHNQDRSIQQPQTVHDVHNVHKQPTRTGIEMFYFKVDRYIIITVITILCIANLILTSLTLYSYEIDKLFMVKLINYVSISILLIPLLSYALYLLQLRTKTLTFEIIEKENYRRKRLNCIMLFCLGLFNFQGIINIAIYNWDYETIWGIWS